MNNEFYKLLLYFRRGEKITRTFLLHKPFITADLIDRAVKLKYIAITTPSATGDTRYTITESGIQKRDN